MTKFIILCLSVCLLNGTPVLAASFNGQSGSDEVIAEEHPEVPETGSQEKLAALTFDDGPGEYTAALLDGLAERGAKATFFISTVRVSDKNSDIIRRMDAEGHEVANHTASHARLHQLTTDQIKKEVSDADKILREITGKTPALFRPPYGNYTTRVLNAVEKPAITWSIDTRDCFDNKDPASIEKCIVERISDGDIILLHEWGSYSKDGALRAVDALTKQGYRFVTVSELFAEKHAPLEAGKYYAAANGRDFEERLVFDKDDKFPDHRK